MAGMEGITLYHIDYYEKNIFKGSYRGMCFRIGKADEKLHVVAWRGPYILEKTSEDVYEEDFPFTEEGLIAADEWLADKQVEICEEEEK